MPDANAPRKRPLGWVSSTYFAEGLPYMVVRVLSSVFFTDIGAKERYLGYLNFLGLPWNLKFLWSPFLDAYGTKRRWLVWIQFLLAALTMAVAGACLLAGAAPDPNRWLAFIATTFLVMAFVAATNDIAIDGYYIEALPEKDDQAAWSGHRVMAYRFSIIFARSGLVALAAWAASRAAGDASGPYRAWALAFGAGAATLFVLALGHALFLPRVETERSETLGPAAMLKFYGRAFASFLAQPRIAISLAFIVLYKLGDEVMFSMGTPFLLRELGVSKAQFAWLGGLVGAGASIVGSLLGAWFIKKYSFARSIWPLTLAMNVNIWVYYALAALKPSPTSGGGLTVIAVAHAWEQIAAGLGNAVLVIYILRTCKPDFKAAHFAIGSAIMSLGGTLIGGFGGRLVEMMGYTGLFALAFVVSLPGMALIPWLPLREPESEAAR